MKNDIPRAESARAREHSPSLSRQAIGKSVMALTEAERRRGINMLEAKTMGLMIFTMLNVLGVGFLLYVLVNFWKEEHKSTSTIRARSRESANNARPNIIVVRAPITVEGPPKDGGVIRFPLRSGAAQQRDEIYELGGTRRASR
jgi:hypothetical protein